MIQAIYDFAMTMSPNETVFGIVTLFLTPLYFVAPINRITVIFNRIFGDGTSAIVGQSTFGLILELFWYANVYYFVSEFVEYVTWY